MTNRMLAHLIVLALLAGAGAAGCGSEEKGSAPGVVKPGGGKDPSSVFTDAIAAYNGHDLAALVALFDPGVEWILRTAMQPTIQGRAALARHLMNERSIFPDCAMGIRRMIVKDGNVAVQGVFRATHQGVAHNIEATGNKVSYEFLYFVATEKGKIRRNVAYLNPATAYRHMGAIASEGRQLPSFPEKPEIVRGSESQENVKLVEKFFDEWQGGKIEEAVALLAPGAVFEDTAAVETHSGAPAVTAYMKEVSGSFDKLKFEVKNIASIGSYLAVQLVQRGVYRMKPEGGKKEVPKEVALDRAFVIGVEGGKITEAQLYFDELQLYKYFGYSLTGALLEMGGGVAPAADGGAPVAAEPKPR